MAQLTQHRKQQWYYVLADVLSSVLVWLGFLMFRWLVYEGRIFSMETVLIPAFDFYLPLLTYPLFCLVIYYLSGFYLRPFGKGFAHEFLDTLVASVPIAFGAFFVIIIDDVVANYTNYYQSLLVLWLLQFSLSYAARLVVSLLTGAHRHKVHAWTLKGEDITRLLNGNMPDIPAEVEHVIVEMPQESSEQDLYRVINKVYPLRKDISFTAKLYDMLLGSASIRDAEDQPLVNITSLPMSDMAMCVKRAFDVVVSSVCLIVLCPLLLVLALVVKCSSPGPVLYKQERIGHYGRKFSILKYRTMYVDAENGVPLLSRDDDPRVTRAGRIMRKYRLDELPQFLNVLRGDMSFVGPRPEREYFVNQIIEVAPYYCLIYKIRPGLTSWGPIRVGYTDTLEKMVQRLNYDIMYTENMSLALDVKIMLKTVRVILDGKGK